MEQKAVRDPLIVCPPRFINLFLKYGFDPHYEPLFAMLKKDDTRRATAQKKGKPVPSSLIAEFFPPFNEDVFITLQISDASANALAEKRIRNHFKKIHAEGIDSDAFRAAFDDEVEVLRTLHRERPLIWLASEKIVNAYYVAVRPQPIRSSRTQHRSRKRRVGKTLKSRW